VGITSIPNATAWGGAVGLILQLNDTGFAYDDKTLLAGPSPISPMKAEITERGNVEI